MQHNENPSNFKETMKRFICIFLYTFPFQVFSLPCFILRFLVLQKFVSKNAYDLSVYVPQLIVIYFFFLSFTMLEGEFE